ncbi:MAG: hypothetical protein U0Z26_03375 [Anaerolineales bacterium]
MKFLRFLPVFLLLSACVTATPAPEPTPTIVPPSVLVSADNAYGPLPTDASLRQAGVVLSSVNLIERTDLNPSRVELDFLGSMPSTCNQLRIEVGLPNEQYQIFVTIYSLVNTKIKCDNVFQLFDASVLLGVYSPGRYTVWVNGGQVGDFVTY